MPPFLAITVVHGHGGTWCVITSPHVENRNRSQKRAFPPKTERKPTENGKSGTATTLLFSDSGMCLTI